MRTIFRCPFLTVALLGVLVFSLQGPLLAQEKASEGSLEVEVHPWEEAQRLFRGDPHWLGGDGASSADLGDGRVLWLFGDSFVNLSTTGSRRDATMVRNSVAIQHGHDPATARMTFAWKRLGPHPRSFFREQGVEWFWPGSAVRIGRGLLVFLVRVGRADNALGFESSGWKAVFVPNPDVSPTLWGMRDLAVPRTGGVLVGSASAFVLDGYLYAYGSDRGGHAAYAARWKLEDAVSGNLAHPQWWMGPELQWAGSGVPRKMPAPVFTGCQVEFTVHYEPELGGLVQVQTLSLADPCLALRFAATVSSAWSGSMCFFQPPERSSQGLLLYAGKAHKAFAGSQVAFTYAVNTLDPHRIMDDMGIYFPVVLKGTIRPRPDREGSP
ncbi:MAG TPA: hypothetical protein PLU54_06495 [Deltaproteobacteria bacterium]|nr:hypothetical protein [Deltaproteobacteria bacterium]